MIDHHLLALKLRAAASASKGRLFIYFMIPYLNHLMD